MSPTSRRPADRGGDAALDRRLENLEVKLSFAEDLIDKLDTVVVRQQQQIDRLTQQLLQLRDRAADTEPRGARSLRDELPPHY